MPLQCTSISSDCWGGTSNQTICFWAPGIVRNPVISFIYRYHYVLSADCLLSFFQIFLQISAAFKAILDWLNLHFKYQSHLFIFNFKQGTV